jgi:deoxyribose-phosphate aldolase
MTNKSIKDSVLNDIEQQKQNKQQETSKYEQALSKYNLNVKDEEVKTAVKKIIAEKASENDIIDVKKFLLGSIELTSLHTTDTEEEILAMVEKVNQFDSDYADLPHVAAICTYPVFAKLISQSLEVDGVEITNVCGNFPSSQTFIEVKIAETALALKDGATEIDSVMPVGKFLSEDYEGVADEIQELKETCGENAMKVILETGDLGSCANIKKASILAMYAGADYIKTSTGKEKVSATPESVYVMCQAIKEYYEQTGIQIGLKPAGGINTVMDAVIFYTIVKEVLGKKWLTNKWFRLGTSRLTNLLLSEILGKEIKYF